MANELDKNEPSLTEDLDSMYEEADKIDEPEEEVIIEEVDEEGNKIEKGTTEKPLEEISEIPEELEALLAPNSWKKDFHESFGTMSRETQQYILDRESDYERGIGEKGQEIAGFKQRLEGFDQSLAPLIENWKRQGMNPMDGLNSLIGWSQNLASNPQDTLMQLAKFYNIDLTKATEEQPYVDPATTVLENKMGEMQRTIDNFTNAGNQDKQNAAYSQLDTFENAVDSEGNKAHPHFNEVIDDMVMVMQTGRAKDLDSAYELAVRFNPDIQAKLSEQQTKDKAHAKTQQAKKATEASKQSVSSKGTGGIENEDISLEDELSRAYDDVA